MSQMIDVELKDAQKNQMAKNNAVSDSVIALNAAKASEQIRDTRYKTLMESISAQAAELSLKQQISSIEKSKVDQLFTRDENFRKWVMLGRNLKGS